MFGRGLRQAFRVRPRTPRGSTPTTPSRIAQEYLTTDYFYIKIRNTESALTAPVGKIHDGVKGEGYIRLREVKGHTGFAPLWDIPASLSLSGMLV